MRIIGYIKRHIKVLIIIVAAVLFSIWCILGFNQNLEVSTYNFQSSDLPASFDDFRIVQLSDLHCQEFGEEQKDLVDKIALLKPDIIVLTGDMIDGYHRTIDATSKLIKSLSVLCPIYAVNGNHEKDELSFYLMLSELYRESGVTVLNDKSAKITHEDGSIYIYGSDWYTTSTAYNVPVSPKEEAFSILLYHNASLFYILSKKGYDLVLSGHTHGGIIRLPLVGGIFASNRSLFPAYNGGRYDENNSTLISNRGLGYSTPPIPRFRNRPEVVLIMLQTQ